MPDLVTALGYGAAGLGVMCVLLFAARAWVEYRAGRPLTWN